MKTLIDRAIETCGSVNELARRMDVKPNVISMMRKNRTITPDTAAMLAAVAGEDSREAAIQAMIENSKGTRREGVLREILGKGLALGVAGVLAFSYSKDSISGKIRDEFVKKEIDSLYIVEYLTKMTSGWKNVFRVVIASLHGGAPHTPRCLSVRQRNTFGSGGATHPRHRMFFLLMAKFSSEVMPLHEADSLFGRQSLEPNR